MKTDLLIRLGRNTGFAACVAAGLLTANFAQAQCTKGSGALTNDGSCTAAAGGNSCTNTSVGAAAGAALNNGFTNNTYIGSSAGTACTQSTANSFVGSDCGLSNTTGSENAFMGRSSGRSNISADYNTFMGAYSANSNTHLSANDAFGWKALYTQSYNPGGFLESYNVAIGSLSLFNNNPTASTNGIKNTALGHASLYTNTTGLSNLACGYRAGYSNTTASNNSFLGVQAGYNNTTGTQNVMLGENAGFYNVTGNYNTVGGFEAGSGVAGNSYSYNTFYGYKAGRVTTTAQKLVCIGAHAGYNNSSGSYNTFVGYNSGVSNTTGTVNTFLGYGSGYLTTGGNNTFLGADAGNPTTTGTQNTFVGRLAGYGNTTGSTNTCVGYGADVNGTGYTNATAIGNGAISTGNNIFYCGNVNAALYCAGGVWTGSDGRFKFNVKEEVKGLDFINRLRPVTYQLNTEEMAAHITKHMPDSIRSKHLDSVDFSTSKGAVRAGFIAQEVEQAAIASGFISDIVRPSRNDADHYALNYAEIVVPLVKAVQELSKKLDSLTEVSETQSAIIKKSINNHSDQELMTGESNAGINKKEEDVKLSLPEAPTIGDAHPNPNSGSTQIPYFVPENVTGAKVIFTDMLGRVLEERQLQAGYGQLNLDTRDLPSGTYSYSLIVDGKVIDNKKIIKN